MRFEGAMDARMEDRIRDKAVEHSRLIAQEIARLANELAPRLKTGRVKPSGNEDDGPPLHESYEPFPLVSGEGWQVISQNRYWRYVEFGTRQHGRAQPHVSVALRIVKDRHT